jgi:hypothetical protein
MLLDELGRFLTGEDTTPTLAGAILAGSLLLGTAWAAAIPSVRRWACGLVGTTVLIAAAVTQPDGWTNVGGSVAALALFFGGVVALARHQDRRDGRTPPSWRGGFLTRPRRAPRPDRKHARRTHDARTNELAIALGVEIALLRIAAGLDPLTLADRLGIPGSRYSTIEEADRYNTCVTVADLEAIADFHDTTVTDLYGAARDRIARGELPTGQQRAAHHLALALGLDDDSYYADHLGSGRIGPRTEDFETR